jgi:hypothetical protein
MLNVNSWKIVKRMSKQYYHYCKESNVEIFSMSKKFPYYKIQHGGGKILVLANKVVIVFIMKIMHK